MASLSRDLLFVLMAKKMHWQLFHLSPREEKSEHFIVASFYQFFHSYTTIQALLSCLPALILHGKCYFSLENKPSSIWPKKLSSSESNDSTSLQKTRSMNNTDYMDLRWNYTLPLTHHRSVKKNIEIIYLMGYFYFGFLNFWSKKYNIFTVKRRSLSTKIVGCFTNQNGTVLDRTHKNWTWIPSSRTSWARSSQRRQILGCHFRTGRVQFH